MLHNTQIHNYYIYNTADDVPSIIITYIKILSILFNYIKLFRGSFN